MNTCGQCGERATCAYGYGAAELYACAAHDPTHQPGWATVTLGCNFTYRTLPAFPMATTGHLGIPGIDPNAPQVIYPGTAAHYSPGFATVAMTGGAIGAGAALQYLPLGT